MSDNQPDWGAIAQGFDLWLPHLAPVTDTLVDHLAPEPGSYVLDVAAGTGEPALTLARNLGGGQVLAIDAAKGMIDVAAAKAAEAGLANLAFELMPAEAMTFADDTFDRVVCRFGVMLFTDPIKGLAEIWRVLKPGGRFALAVWGDPDQLSSFKFFAEVLDPLMPEGNKTAMSAAASLGPDGALEAALEAAGFQGFSVTRHQLDYNFPDFDSYWALMEGSGILAQQFAALSPAQLASVRDEVAHRAAAYQRQGRLILPHAYLVASGTR